MATEVSRAPIKMNLCKTQKGYEVLSKVRKAECWLQLKEGQRSKRVSETQQHWESLLKALKCLLDEDASRVHKSNC